MMIMVMYLFSTKNGCNFINWWQRLLFRGKKNDIAARPMTRHTSIVTFMELMMLLWTSYLLLMFCYDDVFLGENHPVTLLVGVGCLSARSLSSPNSCAFLRGGQHPYGNRYRYRVLDTD